MSLFHLKSCCLSVSFLMAIQIDLAFESEDRFEHKLYTHTHTQRDREGLIIHIDYIHTLQTQTYKRTAFATV